MTQKIRTRRINLASAEVKRFPVRGNGLDKMLEIETPRGTTYLFSNPSKIILKLYDNSGTEIPLESEVYVFKKRNGEDFGTFLGKFPYQGYYGLSEGDQRNVKFADQVTQYLGPVDKAGIRNPQEHTLEFWIDSPVAVDLSRTETRFEILAVEQN
ncbi:hypothetical protein [Calidithermus chliarophilus]|uniref:hypothetical protein n=1 Tax=Calidithermus chliarophilus TaxID=52023 RepID=UPI000415FCAC|nr:hypothetical protein [Calidithermus chliarophilus]